MPTLTWPGVRRLLLGAQGLLEPRRGRAGKDDVLAAIRRMGILQIDTIHVVARSPYLVLWSRLGTYDPRWLDDLLAEGKLFEYWSHAACFIPIGDYHLYRRDMLQGHPRARAWLDAHPEVAERVLARVRDEGEVRSAHFERAEGRGGTWWDWKPEKLALECLYSTGRLTIARRDPNFHRVYDLTERVLPHWDESDAAGPDEARRVFVEKSVRALGATTAAWMGDYFRLPKKGLAPTLQGLVDDGIVHQVSVQGSVVPVYVHADNLPLLEREVAGDLTAKVTTFLSPFDPIVWDRARARDLFGFEYKIEVYTPEAKRRYGYFTLPILDRDALVGRVDAKAHRKEGRFAVRSLHLEPGVRVTGRLTGALASALRACARWHGTPEVTVEHSEPPALREALIDALR